MKNNLLNDDPSPYSVISSLPLKKLPVGNLRSPNFTKQSQGGSEADTDPAQKINGLTFSFRRSSIHPPNNVIGRYGNRLSSLSTLDPVY